MEECNQCKGLKMQVGRLKKQIERLKQDKPEMLLPDFTEYVNKVDVMLNCLKNKELDGMLEKFEAEANNFKTLFEHLELSFQRPDDD